MTERPPKFCPDCGAALTDDTAAVGIFDGHTGDGGYDVYCETCGWSGDVFPDDEQGMYTGEESKKKPAYHPREDLTRRR